MLASVCRVNGKSQYGIAKTGSYVRARTTAMKAAACVSPDGTSRFRASRELNALFRSKSDMGATRTLKSGTKPPEKLPFREILSPPLQYHGGHFHLLQGLYLRRRRSCSLSLPTMAPRNSTPEKQNPHLSKWTEHSVSAKSWKTSRMNARCSHKVLLWSRMSSSHCSSHLSTYIFAIADRRLSPN